MELHMNPFKGRHFQRDIILWAVRWYCKYSISYRELQEMLAERGVNVDPLHDLPLGSGVMRLKWKNGCAGTGVTLPIFARGMDETYVKVNGRWAYLYRAVDSGAALSILSLSPVVTAKLHTGFWVKSSTT